LIEHIGDEVDALEGEERGKAVDDWAKEVGRVQLAGTVGHLSFVAFAFATPYEIKSANALIGIAAGTDAAFTAYFCRKRGIRW